MNVNIVKNLDLFQNADGETLQTIANLLKVKDYSKGSHIFLEDEKAFGVCFLIEGAVKLLKSDQFGKEHILKMVPEGSVFGEVVLFLGGNYPATALAVKDSKVAILYNEDLEKQVVSNPLLAINLIKIISTRLRIAQDKIKELALLDAKRRLYNLILRWAEAKCYGCTGCIKCIKCSNDKIIIDMKLTQQEIAELIGTTRETVTRTLKELKDKGIIEFKKGKIILLALDRLKNLCIDII
ncbi:Crp/Fnr family transcriptional regulator [Anaerobranca californiensis]|nr:Crp/Fnr family transcriptional regulator [Anaerobranca californiensis]